MKQKKYGLLDFFGFLTILLFDGGCGWVEEEDDEDGGNFFAAVLVLQQQLDIFTLLVLYSGIIIN